MSEQELTLRERASLMALMAAAREVTNAELREMAGLAIDGACRRTLNDRRLVRSTKVGRSYVHELTDEGALWCAAELSAPRPPRSGYGGAALYAVLAGIQRHLTRTGQVLAEVFRPDVESQVKAAYADLARGKVTSIKLADLRERLDGVPREEVDHALDTLARRPGVHIRAEADQKTLTDRDHEAAVVLGDTPRHLVLIEAGS
jgi:hypothetical protein